MKRLSLLIVIASVLFACAVPPPNPTTFNFARPAAVALLCTRIETQSNGQFITDTNGNFLRTPVPHPINDCRSEFDTSVADPHLDPDGHWYGMRLFAFVTQSDRGELAVVNLHPTYNTGIVDNDPTVPGFTFIPVGAFPSAVAVHPTGATTYVANSGEQTVSVIDNTTILHGGRNRELLDTGVPNSSTVLQIRLNARPTDIAIGTVGARTMLYVALPDQAEVAVLDVTDPTAMPTPSYVSLGARVLTLDGGVFGADGGSADAGMGTSRPERLVIATVDQEMPGATLGDVQQVYVSDSRSPIVHVLNPMADGSLVEGMPLEAGIATRPLTVTPTILTTTPTTRFVYAAGADDGTLLVLDTTTRHPVLVNALLDNPACQVGSSSFNLALCPRINPKIDPYRVPLTSAVISLATVTRDALNPSDCLTRVPAPTGTSGDAGTADSGVANSAACDTANTLESIAAVNTIRGVAVIAGQRNSQLAIVDVEDWQANCAPQRVATPDLPPVQAHTIRPLNPYQASNLTGQVSAPTYTINGGANTPAMTDPQIVGPNNSPAECTNPPYCVSLTPIYGQPGTVNARAVREDTWTLTFEGIIPGLTVTAGRFTPVPGDTGEMTLTAPGAEFCTHGALGPDPAAPNVPRSIITLSDMSPCAPTPAGIDAGLVVDPDTCSPDGGANAEICGQIFGSTTAPCNRQLDVLAINGDTLTVVPHPDPSGCGPMLPATELAQRMRECYPQAFRFDVRPNNAWTVVGSLSGYQHNVVLDPATNSCVIDPNRTPSGRLIENQTYEGGAFSLRINSGTTPTQLGAAYQFSITGGFTPLAVAGAVAPGAMQYSCTARRLYLVDQYRASLIEYPVAPMATPRTFN